MFPALPPYHLHIYHGCTEELCIGSLTSLLNDEERNRLCPKRDKQVRIASRAWLKKLLASYLDITPDSIHITYGLNGKPMLKDNPDIQFSVCHTDNVFALAFVRNSQVGIDLENLNRPVNTTVLSELLFSERERDVFQHTDERFHPEQLINSWTRKEAFTKALGLGLSFPLQQLEVSFRPHEPAEVLATRWAEQEKADWYLKSFDIHHTYRGAVAVQGNIDSVTMKDITSNNLVSI